MLCHTTIWSAGSVAGLGEKDCAPFSLTTLIVTTPLAGAGVDAGLGVTGVGFALSTVEPQPHANTANATITQPTNTRMPFLILLSNFVTSRERTNRSSSVYICAPAQIFRPEEQIVSGVYPTMI